MHICTCVCAYEIPLQINRVVFALSNLTAFVLVLFFWFWRRFLTAIAPAHMTIGLTPPFSLSNTYVFVVVVKGTALPPPPRPPHLCRTCCVLMTSLCFSRMHCQIVSFAKLSGCLSMDTKMYTFLCQSFSLHTHTRA